jgi:thioredoxin reductase
LLTPEGYFTPLDFADNLRHHPDRGLTITDKEGKKQTIEADNILVALPWSANTELHERVEERFPEVYSIGDCREPNRTIHAVYDGSRIGRLI